jgi:DNA-binding XRE family transcriptional regulator
MTLKEYRVMLGWAPSELARRAGVAVRTVNRIEDGQPTYDYTLGAIARAISTELGRTVTIHDFDGVIISPLHVDTSRNEHDRQQLSDSPDVIGEASCHRWGPWSPAYLFCRIFSFYVTCSHRTGTIVESIFKGASGFKETTLF